jgi:hypothetical protein
MATGSLEYDIDAFVKKQKAIGRPDEEVKSFLEKNFNPQVAQLYFEKPEEKTAENPVKEFFKQIPSEVLIPGVGALAGGAGVGAGYAFKSLKDRMAESKGAPPRIDPLMDVNQRPPTGRIEPDFNKPAPSVVQITKDPIEQRLFEISQAQQAAKTQPPMMGQPGFQPSAPVAPPSVQALDQAFSASLASPAVQTAPAAPVAPTPPASAEPTIEPKKTGGRPTKQAVAAEMEGKVFKEGFGGADNYLEKQFGPDIRRFMKDEFNQGKPYGGGQAAMDKAYADIKKYDTWLKENIPVQTLNREERKAMGVPPPKDYPVLGKAMKVGGVAGLLMTAGQAANAREAMGNVAEALLPLGMTPSELAPGTLTKKQLEAYKEAQKLGSPYRSVPPR